MCVRERESVLCVCVFMYLIVLCLKRETVVTQRQLHSGSTLVTAD